MKLKALLALIALTIAPSVSASPDASCNNGENVPYKPCEEENSGGQSSSQSKVANGNFGYFTWTHDFSFPNVTSGGCGSCGAAVQTGDGGLPALQITRLHSLRASQHTYTSFGQKAGLEGYDKNLILRDNNNKITYTDFKSTMPDTSLHFDPTRGGWANDNSRGKGVFCLYLYKTDGSPIMNKSERNEAYSG